MKIDCGSFKNISFQFNAEDQTQDFGVYHVVISMACCIQRDRYLRPADKIEFIWHFWEGLCSIGMILFIVFADIFGLFVWDRLLLLTQLTWSLLYRAGLLCLPSKGWDYWWIPPGLAQLLHILFFFLF